MNNKTNFYNYLGVRDSFNIKCNCHLRCLCFTIFSHLHSICGTKYVPVHPMRPVPTFEISKGVGIIRIVSEIV